MYNSGLTQLLGTFSKASALALCLSASLISIPRTIMAGPAPNRFDQQFEINFMKGGMIDHHQMAVEMSAVCLQKQIRPGLEALCQAINQSQKQEIITMQDMLMNWYGIHYAPILSSDDQEMVTQMSALDGDQFSKMFMEHMIIHHWGAVINSGTCVDRAWHDGLDHLCQIIIKSQAKEIMQMQEWLFDWYHVKNYRPHGRQLADEEYSEQDR